MGSVFLLILFAVAFLRKNKSFTKLPIFTPYKSGEWTEILTERAISELTGYCKFLHNIYLPNNGRTAEVDVVLVHEKGIFVFESKDYSGWIFGSAEQQNWTQVLNKGKKYQFYSPIKQNATHCRALSAFLGVPLNRISSYIVFSDRSELKQVPEDTDSQKLTHLSSLPYKLKHDLDERTTVFTQPQVDEFWAKLHPLTQVSEEVKDKHVEEARKFKEGTVCPLCGGTLVLRSGRYGQFYGCSNYPKCRFTRNAR